MKKLCLIFTLLIAGSFSSLFAFDGKVFLEFENIGLTNVYERNEYGTFPFDQFMLSTTGSSAVGFLYGFPSESKLKGLAGLEVGGALWGPKLGVDGGIFYPFHQGKRYTMSVQSVMSAGIYLDSISYMFVKNSTNLIFSDNSTRGYFFGVGLNSTGSNANRGLIEDKESVNYDKIDFKFLLRLGLEFQVGYRF